MGGLFTFTAVLALDADIAGLGRTFRCVVALGGIVGMTTDPEEAALQARINETLPADIGPREVAGYHSRGAAAVFTHDRGTSVAAMAEAFERFMRTRRDVGGLISAGGSSGTSMATAGMRALPVGTPKFMVSTVASSDVSRYVGPSDI